MHFLGRLGELPTVYMMTRKPIYLILQLCFADININLGIWYLLFPAPFSYNLFQSCFYYYAIKYCPLPCQCKGNREPFCISRYSNFLNLTVPACTSARYCSN